MQRIGLPGLGQTPLGGRHGPDQEPAHCQCLEAWSLVLRPTTNICDDPGSTYQSWIKQDLYDHGTWLGYYLRNQATGECLDDSGEYGLRMFTCYYNVWQTWINFWNFP